jgi:hypothetical protein
MDIRREIWVLLEFWPNKDRFFGNSKYVISSSRIAYNLGSR